MSTADESDPASLPILHFLPKTESTSTSPPITTDENPLETSTAQNGDVNPSTANGTNEKITTASHSRRVHFPEDDSQLRLISYPPEPLANRPLQSLGVILQRYRAACQRLQIRPLNSLLNQLGTMDDGRKSFHDRLDCLRIANEKIDLKHLDAIEEILSRCRFHTLDLDSSIVDDATLSQLFDILEYYESCTHINLSNHRSMAYQGYQALTKYLRKTNCLERLDMNSMRFDDNSILACTRSVRLSSTLYELHVESCQLNGKLLQKFITNLRACTSLRELYLCDNRLQVQDSLLINDLIRTCGSFLYLLDLRSNSLQDNGMSHLASQFSQYDEHHTNESQLQKISFQNNQLTQQGAGFLAKALLHNRTIRSINLSNNNITNEGLFLLRDALLTNRTINELILRNCRLTDQAIIALAEFIAESSTIQYIDLRENVIQASGICGMAIAIRNNKSLLRLDFDPIVSTPTNAGSLLAPNNIDRTGNANSSLLSLSNLRRMTTTLGSFAGSATPFQAMTGGGNGTRELLEQKARWMNDIAAICQRNILIYEENLRVEAEQGTQQTVNGNTEEDHQQASTTVQSEDVEPKDQTIPVDEIIPPPTTEHEQIPSSNQDTIEEIPSEIITTNETTIDTIERSAVDIPTEEISTDNIDVELPVDNPESSEANIPESNSTSDAVDEVNDDTAPQRKFRHSDSIYLLRKKVNHEVNDNTSDDDSQLSSLDEPLDETNQWKTNSDGAVDNPAKE